MAEETIKDFTINWIVLGLLFFSLMSFAISFMYNNNPLGLDENSNNTFNQVSQNLSGKLYGLETDSDTVLNITANTNPEASNLGSRDSVSSAYQQRKSSMGFFDSLKIFISWIFTGEMGKMILAIFGGIVGFTSLYFIVKWIRNGI